VLLLLATAADAPAGPLSECYAISTSRVEIGPCLDRQLAEAEADLAAAVRAVRDRMTDLDRVTGRTDAGPAFERAQQRFQAFREAHCAWQGARLATGTGAGDVTKDCLVRMMQARAAELKAETAQSSGGASAEGAPPSQDVVAVVRGHEWRLVGLVVAGTPTPIVPGSAITIRFDDNGLAGGAASLNRYQGGYRLGPDGALVWVGPGFAATRMAGPPDLMQQEAVFLEALQAASRIRIEEGNLLLESATGGTRLTFER
jgi:heat shock protein HslJ